MNHPVLFGELYYFGLIFYESWEQLLFFSNLKKENKNIEQELRLFLQSISDNWRTHSFANFEVHNEEV